MTTWSGRRALVTGASGGIGRAVAVALASEGCSVALAGRDEAALAETAALCAGSPLVAVADVTDPLADGVFTGVLDAFGGSLDLLANVAGSPGRAALLVELDDASFEEAYALHVVAPARLLRLCHGALARAGGAVVNTGFNAPLINAGLEPRLLAKIPGGRAVTPEAIARAVLYAGSPDNRECSGAVLRVDGGQMARL